MSATTERVVTYLLVEDNDDHADIIERCIRHSNLPSEVQRVKRGAYCLNYLAGELQFADREKYPYPDVVLLDIRMPGLLDGLQTLQAIRSDPRHRGLVVMVLTTSDRDEDIKRSYAMGANGYIVKSDDTRGMIAKLLELHWSYTSMAQLFEEHRLPAQGAAPEMEVESRPSVHVQSLLESDEDTALGLLVSSYRNDRKGFLGLLGSLEVLSAPRFASLAYRFALEHRDLLTRGEDVDWEFLRQVVMEKLPQHTAPEEMVALVAGIAAAMKDQAQETKDNVSALLWKGFSQAYLSQSLYVPAGAAD